MLNAKGFTSVFVGGAAIATATGFGFATPANAISFTGGVPSFFPFGGDTSSFSIDFGSLVSFNGVASPEIQPFFPPAFTDPDPNSPPPLAILPVTVDIGGIANAAEDDVDTSATLGFTQIGSTSQFETSASVEFIFTSTQPNETNGLNVSLFLEAGQVFEAIFPTPESVQLSLVSGDAFEVFETAPGVFSTIPVTSNTFVISETQGDFGTFGITATADSTGVPEPLTVVGSLAALGFGGYLKRKKAAEA